MKCTILTPDYANSDTLGGRHCLISLVNRTTLFGEGGSLLDKAEFLYPPAPIGLGDIDVAFGIDGQCVAVREVTQLMPGTSEGRQDLSCGVVQGVNLLVAAVHHVHEFLFLVFGEFHPPGRAARIRHSLSSRSDPNVPLELSHFVEHLYSIALPVANVYQSRITHCDAMDDLRKCSGFTSFGFILCCLVSPLS